MSDAQDPDRLISLTTPVAAEDDARRLARDLAARRLAACVQLDRGLESHYRWQGQLCAEPELRLTVKTTARRLQAIEAFLAEHHPYQLPQLLWQPLSASTGYAAWVREQVGGAGEAGDVGNVGNVDGA